MHLDCLKCRILGDQNGAVCNGENTIHELAIVLASAVVARPASA